MQFYEDKYFYYFIKPRNIASTYGKEYCFLDYLKDLAKKDKTINQIFEFLNDMFGPEKEFGLVNRLDNETGGLLYFAKCPLFAQKHKLLQQQNLTQKTYIADVYGDFPHNEFTIEYPIGHHQFDSTKMVVIKIGDEKYRGTPNPAKTEIKKLYYDKISNTTALEINIYRGVRHQIRCHLASIGYPIVGEKIYIKKKSDQDLHLWSIGLKTNEYEV